MNLATLYKKALNFEFLSIKEGVFLFENAPTPELMAIAHQLRMIQKLDNIVTWQIDRNVNTTNVCVANCKFCNFYRKPGHIGFVHYRYRNL
jgi:cyclic dehypoxanthinyl futalosine synthase